MYIEVMTADKSCERACAHCPYARKDHTVENNGVVNTEVQKTFSVVEGILKIRNKRYFLFNGVPSLPMLEIKEPKLLSTVGFQSNEVEISKGIDNFSNRVKELLKEKSIKPKNISFPVGMRRHLVNQQDVDFALSLISELRSWFLTSKGKSMSIMFDHDFGVKSDLSESFSQIYESDMLHLMEAVKSICSFPRYAMKQEHLLKSRERDVTVYHNQYWGRLASVGSIVQLDHRVISPILIKEKGDDALLKSIYSHIPPTDSRVSLLITPSGVMLGHATAIVNNPIIWVSHEDFRESFSRLGKRDAKIWQIIRLLLMENQYLFAEARKIGLKDSELKDYFTENRKIFYGNSFS
jgi:hypothetical protein